MLFQVCGLYCFVMAWYHRYFCQFYLPCDSTGWEEQIKKNYVGLIEWGVVAGLCYTMTPGS